MELEIYTEIKNGELNQYQQQRLDEFLRRVGGGFVYLYASKKRATPSKEQRGYYWGVMMKALEERSETGYTREEWHDLCKEKFLKRDEHDEEGNLIGSHVVSTESLDTKEREEYHENIRRWAALDFGVIIPEPNEGDF